MWVPTSPWSFLPSSSPLEMFGSCSWFSWSLRSLPNFLLLLNWRCVSFTGCFWFPSVFVILSCWPESTMELKSGTRESMFFRSFFFSFEAHSYFGLMYPQLVYNPYSHLSPFYFPLDLIIPVIGCNSGPDLLTGHGFSLLTVIPKCFIIILKWSHMDTIIYF